MTVPVMKPGSLVIPKQPEKTRAEAAGISFGSLGDEPLAESTTWLLYGGSKVGKTVFVGTAGPRTLIINIGDGMETLKSQWARDKFYKDGWPIITTIQEERDPKTGMFVAAQAFDKVADAIDIAIDEFGDKFDTIAVDDATQMRAFAMNKGLEVNAEFNRSKTLDQAKKSGGHYVPAQQDYGAEMDLIEKFIAGTITVAKKHKKHFILTAHERHIFKKIRDNTGRIVGQEIDKIRPAFTGQTFPDEVPGYFDLVWNLTATRTGQGTVYRAFTEDSMTIKAGSRYPGVFKPIEFDPNFLDAVKRIRASRK